MSLGIESPACSSSSVVQFSHLRQQGQSTLTTPLLTIFFKNHNGANYIPVFFLPSPGKLYFTEHEWALPRILSSPAFQISAAFLVSTTADTMPKSILITGCSSGIGHALALEFNARGLRVFATARNKASISDLAEQGIETFSLEVTDPASIQALQEDLYVRTIGKLDYLVNNAGRNYTVPALDIDMDEARATFETNLFAIMRMCQTFAPLLIDSKGTIVQIGSLAGFVPYVFGSAYNASKAALHSYSDALRVELAPFGVRVVTVVTGGVISNIGRTTRTLPEDSIYLPLAQEYHDRQSHSQVLGMGNEDYAKSVAEKVLAGRKDIVWEGGKSWIAWFAHWYLPKWVLVSLPRCMILQLCSTDATSGELHGQRI